MSLEVLAQYDLGEVSGTEPVADGIINTTYTVRTDRGTYILQRLHPMFDERTVQDYAAVQGELKRRGVPVPALIRARSGSAFIDADGIWRVFEHIDNDAVPINELLAYEAGRGLAKLHCALAEIDYTPRYSIPGFHQTDHIMRKLRRVVHTDPVKSSKVTLEYDLIGAVREHPLHAHAPVLIHGDPKFTNFLFRRNAVAGVIDFDTLMIGNPLLDIGDALRSWCSKRDGMFDQHIYDAAVEGYLSASKEQYTDTAIFDATARITLELAARFLIDHFEESYFQWDRKRFASHADFCLHRCREQLSLYSKMSQAARQRCTY